MKVWVLKVTPDYEQPTGHGTYVTPSGAADKFAELVRENAFRPRVGFSLRYSLGAEDCGITIVYNSYDTITLAGLHVEGSGRVTEPSVTDRRDLSQLVLDLLREAACDYGFTNMNVADDIWVLRQTD